MKLNRLIVMLVVFAMVSVAAVAQETDADEFLADLSLELAELGWDDDVVAEFEGAAEELDWSGAENADPRLLAWALEFGISDDALAVQERVQIALALANNTAQMTRLGYSDRDIAAAAMEATRTVVQEMTQLGTGGENSDPVNEMIRVRMKEAMEEQTRTMKVNQVRGGNASGSAYGVGESDAGIPLGPDDTPNPGDPAGPGAGSQDGPGGQSGRN